MEAQRDDKALSAAFASLPVEQQEAMESAARRRILRLLHRGAEPLSSVDLAINDSAPLSSVNYHAQVLSTCGLIDVATTRQVRGNAARCFVSTVTGHRGILSILSATEVGDGSSGDAAASS